MELSFGIRVLLAVAIAVPAALFIARGIGEDGFFWVLLLMITFGELLLLQLHSFMGSSKK